MKLCTGRGRVKVHLPSLRRGDGMIVVVETNATRTVKFAKQMLVDASAVFSAIGSAAVTTFLFRVKELARSHGSLECESVDAQ